MISNQDSRILKKVISEIIDRKFRVSGWKELSYSLWGGDSNRDFYFRRLKPRYQKVLILRYGLRTKDFPKTLEQTGEILGGVSRENVRQLEEKALAKLRGIYRKTYNSKSKAKRFNDQNKSTTS